MVEEKNTDEQLYITIIKDINDGFESIRKEMRDGFKESARMTSDLAEEFAALNEKVNGINSAQGRLEKAVKEIKDMKDDVKLNTKFREDVVGVLKIALYVVVAALTSAAIWGFASYIVNNGSG